MSDASSAGSDRPDPYDRDMDAHTDTHSCGFSGDFELSAPPESVPESQSAPRPRPQPAAELAAESAPPVAPPGVVLRRALRLRCPVCGEGRVFPDGGLRHADSCESCEWQFERCEGHWVGGSEINMLLTFPFGCALAGGLTAVIGFGVWAFVLSGLGVIGFSLAIQRQSRTVFLAIDYLIDPRPDPASGGFPGFGRRDGPDVDHDPAGPRRPPTDPPRLVVPLPVDARGPSSATARPEPAKNPAKKPASNPSKSRPGRRPGDRPAHT